MSYFMKGWGLLFLLLFLCKGSFAQQRQVEPLHIDINTRAYDEIAPIVSRDEQTMFFTRQGYPIYNKTLLEKGIDLSGTLNTGAYNKKLSEIFSAISGRSITNAATSSYNQDIWVAKTKNTLLDQVSHPSTPLNNAFPNSLCALYNNEQSAIVINQFPSEGGIKSGFSVCHKNKAGNWSTPQPITIQGIDNNKMLPFYSAPKKVVFIKVLLSVPMGIMKLMFRWEKLFRYSHKSQAIKVIAKPLISKKVISTLKNFTSTWPSSRSKKE